MPRTLLTLQCLFLLTLFSATNAQAKDKVQWPVRNPLILKKYTPNTKQRVISGAFGPRLKWGANRYDHHEGWDFYAFYDPAISSGNHPVYNIATGVVQDIINPPNPERVETGRKVVVLHKLKWSSFGGPSSWGPVYTGYNHLQSIAVTKGQVLKAGDVIGVAGESGYTKTVHLHFNCYRFDGKRLVNVNPARLYRKSKSFLTKMSKSNCMVKIVHVDRDKDLFLMRIAMPHNCMSFDGFILEMNGEKKRGISFEFVSASMRDKRDKGDRGLFEDMFLYPLRFNGGDSSDRLNRSTLPRSWPARQFMVNIKGSYQAWDVLVTKVPDTVKKLTITLRGVNGEKVKLKTAIDKG